MQVFQGFSFLTDSSRLLHQVCLFRCNNHRDNVTYEIYRTHSVAGSGINFSRKLEKASKIQSVKAKRSFKN